jgi:membrane dipeptidase
MNRLGIMVDVSHISDEAFADVLEVSKVPVIASHSSCRQFTPGWQRNMSDDMIRALAKKEGVIQINFGSGFIEGDIQVQTAKNWDEIERILADKGLDFGDPKAAALVDAYWQENPRQYSTVEKVADHIEHVIKLVGIDHVGFGSDFDGVGDSLPAGLKDVSHYPNLIAELLERGYSPQDLEKICSGNVLRVWAAVQEYARKQAALPSDAGH